MPFTGNNDYEWGRYGTINKEYSLSLVAAREAYDKKTNESLSDTTNLTPRTWWRTVKSVLGFNYDGHIPSLQKGQFCILDDLSKAKEFNQFFISHSNIDDTNVQLPADIQHCPSNLDHLVIEEQDVLDILKTRDVNKATGPDSIPASC